MRSREQRLQKGMNQSNIDLGVVLSAHLVTNNLPDPAKSSAA
jgi:hypothetical protein